MSTLTYSGIIDRVEAWTVEHDDIRAVIIIGSRARVNFPADEWSDLDLFFVTSAPERYLDHTDWLQSFGRVWATFTEHQAVGQGIERRVLFEDALDVDFIPLPPVVINHMIENGWPPDVTAILRRGYRVLVDKDGFGPHLLRASQQADQSLISQLPDETEFLALWNDFFYHAVWSAKKLRRGEIWTAKNCVDSFMKWQLLRLIEWHGKATQGADFDTWHSGRFLENWVPAQILVDLSQTFAHYEAEDTKRALQSTLDLFRKLAQQVAGLLNFAYPLVSDNEITVWLNKCLSLMA